MTVADDFDARNIRPTLLFDLVLDSGERNFWSGPHQIETDGKVYLPLVGLDGRVSVLQSLEIDDLGGDIQVRGSSPEILAFALTEPFQNRVVNVHIASLDESFQVQSKQLEFSGFLDDIRIQEGPDNPTLDILVRGTFSDLEVTSEIRYAAADQAEVDDTDTFFDFQEAAAEGEPRFGA